MLQDKPCVSFGAIGQPGGSTKRMGEGAHTKDFCVAPLHPTVLIVRSCPLGAILGQPTDVSSKLPECARMPEVDFRSEITPAPFANFTMMKRNEFVIASLTKSTLIRPHVSPLAR